MRQETVTVKIAKDGSGNMKIECEGFVGEGCDVIKDVETQLGFVTKTEDTAERYQYEIPDPAFNELAG